MTAKNNHPELIAKLAEGIENLTSSEEWQHYLDLCVTNAEGGVM